MVRIASKIITIQYFGEMYQSDNAVAAGVSAQNQWEHVVNFSAGELSGGVTFGSSAMTIPVTARYQVAWAASSASAGTGKTYEIALSVDDVIDTKSRARRRYSTSDVGASAGHAILSLTAGCVVKLEVRCIDASTSDITIIECDVQVHAL